MAIVRLGHLVGGISGNLGSSNFANSRTSTIVRRRPTRTRPTSQKQLLRQARYALFKTQWDDLSIDDKDAWRTQAQQLPFRNKLGSKFYLSGWQLWMRSRLFLPLDYSSTYSYPFGPLHPQPPSDFTAQFTAGGPYLITATITEPPILAHARLYLSRPMRTVAPKHFRAWTYCHWRYLPPMGGQVDFTSRIEEYVGNLYSGEVVGLRLHSQWLGPPLSTPLIISTTVA